MGERVQVIAVKWWPELVAWATTLTGVAGYWELLHPILSALTMLIGLVFSIALGYGRVKKGRVERQLLYMERDIMAEEKHELLARAAERKKRGEPLRRTVDPA